MKNLLDAGRVLLLDLASTLLFLAVYLLSDNLFLAVGLGMALGVAQIGWQLMHGKPIGTLQWLSVVLVLASGTATFFTRDPHFVMIKPSVIYVIVGIVMLKRGWMNRYLPPRRRTREGRGHAVRLRLGRTYVRIGGSQYRTRVRPRCQELGGGDVGLGHRQQDRPVPDPVRGHDDGRKAPRESGRRRLLREGALLANATAITS